ncbi:hypothetical protein ASZ78_007855 [Callipepla squamata]|uniref:Golgin subfamily B member 1 n=1 Tax=Callipepla squamata TaxID=9009 RepID=A0A226MJ90_CALSU|nr:hypothetical protein ASZ78_007855 [Callipepla squamata]
MDSNTNSFLSYASFLPHSFLQRQSNQSTREEHRDEAEGLEEQLREQEETIRDLNEQLASAKRNLKDAEIKYTAELSSLQEVIQEKEALLEEQLHQHKAELLRTVAKADQETEVQQDLCVLQRKLEEREEALLGQTQVVELLQQELRAAEQQNQVLRDQCQKMAVDLSSLQDVLDAERRASQDLREKMELEVAERKLCSHRLQEEVQCLSEQLEEARAAQAELERYRGLEQKQRQEVEEKNLQISCLKAAEQEFQSSYAALVAENHQLKQDVARLSALSESSVALQDLQAFMFGQLCSDICALDTLLQAKVPVNFSPVQGSGVVELRWKRKMCRLWKIQPLTQTALLHLEAGADGFPNGGEQFTEENCPSGIRESLAAEKQKELSVLLLELKEAHEEIAFLKGQLRDPNIQTSAVNQSGGEANQLEGNSQAPLLGREEQKASDTQNELDNSSLWREAEMQQINALQENKTGLQDVLQETTVHGTGVMGATQESSAAVPEPGTFPSQELIDLRNQVTELQMTLQKSEESYQKDLGERDAEINRLNQLAEEHRKKMEGSDSAFCALAEERDQLLCQVKDLSTMTELQEQVKQLEEDLALSEKQRLSDSQSSLLKEQIQSLKNEFKSKEDTQLKDMRSQIQKKECEALGHEAAGLEQLVAERSRCIENLQQTLLEKEQQMTEISVSMSEKIVLLNEEKFSLETELKSLKEQTSLWLKAQEGKDQNAEAKDAYLNCEVSEQQYEEAEHEEGEVSGSELEILKRENEQVKRKLQAALVNRKELLRKVSKLENELALKRGPESEAAVAQEAEGEENTMSGVSRGVHLESSPREEHLIQLLSEKESELLSVRKELLDKETAEAQLQAVIEEMKQSLQGPEDGEENKESSAAATNLEENQEALASRKDTIKKAQEKDRHHREQLKQQKDDYNILQEQFDAQKRENESIQAQLRQLQEQRGATESVPGNHRSLDSSCLEAEDPTNSKLVRVADVSGEEFKAELEKLQLEKEELEHKEEGQAGTSDQAEAEATGLPRGREEGRVELREKSEALANAQAQLLEKEDSVKSLCSQIEAQAQAHEEQSKRLQTKLLEIQHKQDDDAEAAKQKSQMQRKLQAALISRKEALKESKSLKEELANAKTTIENLCAKLNNMESQVDGHVKETEKEKQEKEMESLKRLQAAESTEWQEKHRELQKEYETLLQSYENVSNETERIQRVLETARQEKQEIFIKLKSAEAEKEEIDKQLQEAGQEIDGMKEKMRKFAKSKQQKILELEEENEKLRVEMQSAAGDLHRTGDVAFLTSASLKEELESSRRDCQSLSTQLEAVMAEKESLAQEIADLKHHLQLTESKLEESRELLDKYISLKTPEEETDQAAALPSPTERTKNQVDFSFIPKSPNAELEQKVFEGSSPPEDLNTYIKEIAELTERITELEENRRASEQQLDDIRRCVETLEGEKRALETQMEAKVLEFNVLQDTVAKMEEMVRNTKEELIRMTELKDILEAEKDDLEERLMNQLAELNGTIGNYQQDATDSQIENEQLKNEIQSLQRTIHELEEEKRQMAKEKSKASSENQKEYLEKLKRTWREDSNAHVKELQELLKQKQQEIKQLQKDCIKSQEKISSLERTVKALEFVQSESQKDLEAAKETLAKAAEDTKKAKAELAHCRVVLDDTQSEAARVLAESVKVKEELRANKESTLIQMKKKDEDFERRLEREKDKHSKEMKNMEEKLAALQREKDHMETTVRDVQGSLTAKDLEAKELEGSLNKTLAQLAAFTRSMSSLQDDRDRVIDESRTWEKKFTETIQKKEVEIRSKEETCVMLKDQIKQMTAQVEELQVHISRLECNKKDWESESRKEIQQHQETCEMLQAEKKELLTQLEGSQKLYSESQNEQQKLESEIRSLKDQLAVLQSSFTRCELVREELESIVKQQENSIQSFKFSCEQLEADLQASKNLTNKLHEETSAKDQKIISLLSAKEEAVTAALSELQQQHSEDITLLERRLSKEEEDKKALEIEKSKLNDKLDHLTEKMKIIREGSKQQKVQLDSFTKSMASLQDDRDRILREYKQLEERHLVIILEKDQIIQEAAAENNKLKEEIRIFHGQMDDLNSENAKLSADLVRYREDLNQVISIKDSQQKQLLKTQLQRIQALEKEKAVMETQLKESERAQNDLRRCMEALREDKVSMSQEVETLTSSLSQAQSEMTALSEASLIVECQAQLKAQEEEAQELQRKLALSQKRISELEGELVSVQKDATRRVGEAEDRLRKELKHLHHDAGIMRNETETAEERVAELARDLMEMEQKFLAVTDENKDLRAQIQSFGKSMSSLQDSWDQTNEELQALKQKYSADLGEQQNLVENLQKKMLQLQEEQNSTARDRDTLRSEITEMQKAADERGFLAQIEDLKQKIRAKDDELLRLSSDLEGSSNQVKSFSKAMASLQDERDRLLSELDKTRKVEEVKQRAEGSTVTAPSEVLSLKKALSSLQNDRDRLVRELKNLQQQYIQVGVESAENSRLKAQVQEYQQEVDKQHRRQEQLEQESISCQQELQQLRQEKTTWEKQNNSIKEQYLMVIAEKEQQLSRLQQVVQEMRPPLSKPQAVEEQYQKKISPEAVRGDFSSLEAETKHLRAQLSDSLKELHQKELRIQQLNSKLSQVFEEKNALSLQLRGSGRSVCESHQHYSEVLSRCLELEKQLQELQATDKSMESFATDAAPGAPQEKNEPGGSYTPELQELQLRLSETEHLHSSTKQDLRYLEEQLEEERERRVAAEEALSAVQDQMSRLESSEWTSSLSTGIDMTPGHEHSLLIDSMDNNCSKTRNIPRLRRLLRSLFRSRTHLPLLVAMYLLALHVLLFLCFTGHL